MHQSRPNISFLTHSLGILISVIIYGVSGDTTPVGLRCKAPAFTVPAKKSVPKAPSFKQHLDDQHLDEFIMVLMTRRHWCKCRFQRRAGRHFQSTGNHRTNVDKFLQKSPLVGQISGCCFITNPIGHGRNFGNNTRKTKYHYDRRLSKRRACTFNRLQQP